MRMQNLLEIRRVADVLDAGSKKRCLEQMSELLEDGLEAPLAAAIYPGLLGRERLGSTAIGHGVAIPHGRLPGLTAARGAFARYPAGLDFDAADEQPVKLVFALLVPAENTDEHLQWLAYLAETFSHPDLRARLLAARGAEELYQTLIEQAE